MKVAAVPGNRFGIEKLLILVFCLVAVLTWRIGQTEISWMAWAAVFCAVLLVAIRWNLLKASVDGEEFIDKPSLAESAERPGIICCAVMLSAIAATIREAGIVTSWVIPLATISLAFALSLWALGIRRLPPSRLTIRDWIAILIICFSAIPVHHQLAPSWKFALIGDEGAFFDLAKQFVDSGFTGVDPFEASGTYGDHPVALTLWQSLVMWIWGSTPSGWKLSCSLLMVATIPALYGLIRIELEHRPASEARLVATLTCVAYTFSELMLVWSVIGKPHISFIVPLVFTLYLAARYRSEQENIWPFLSGVSAGAGIYLSAYGSAVALILGLSAIFFASLNYRDLPKSRIAPVVLALAGYLIFSLPFLVQFDFFEHLLSKNLADSNSMHGFAYTVEKTWLAASLFIRTNVGTHFLFGNLVDPITSALILLGIIASLILDVALGAQLIGLTMVTAFLTGGIDQYPQPSPTRTLVMMLPYSLLAGVGIAYLVHGSRRFGYAISALVFISSCYNIAKLVDYNPYQRSVEDCNFLPQRLEMLPSNLMQFFIFPVNSNPWLFRQQVSLYGYSDQTRIMHDSPEELEELRQLLKTLGPSAVLSLGNGVQKSEEITLLAKKVGALVLPSFSRFEVPRSIEPSSKSAAWIRNPLLSLIYLSEGRPRPNP